MSSNVVLRGQYINIVSLEYSSVWNMCFQKTTFLMKQRGSVVRVLDSKGMRLGLTTGDMNNGMPCHQLYHTMHTRGHQLEVGIVMVRVRLVNTK